MGIYMGVRKVWPFKCLNSENGPLIYFLFFFFKKKGVYTWRRSKGGGGYSGAHPYYVIHRELPPENAVRGDQKLRKRSPYNASLKFSKTYFKHVKY